MTRHFVIAIGLTFVPFLANAGTVTATFTGVVSSATPTDYIGVFGGGDITGAPFVISYEFDPSTFYSFCGACGLYTSAYALGDLSSAQLSVSIDNTSVASNPVTVLAEREYSGLQFGGNGYDAYSLQADAVVPFPPFLVFVPELGPPGSPSGYELYYPYLDLQVIFSVSSSMNDFLPDYTNATPPSFILTNPGVDGFIVNVAQITNDFALAPNSSADNLSLTVQSVSVSVSGGDSTVPEPSPIVLLFTGVGLGSIRLLRPVRRSLIRIMG